MDHQKAAAVAPGRGAMSRLEKTLFLSRAAPYSLPASGATEQELQGVALRRTRRVDGVRVVGPSLFALSERCAPQRSPPRRRRRGRDPCGGS